jgi:putative transposase
VSLKQDFPKISKEKLCALFGKTRHAFYDHQWRQQQELFCDDIILQQVHQLRSELPRLGTRKLHHKLTPLLEAHGLSVGRDYLFNLLSHHKLLIRQRKRKAVTTDSRHWMRKYANLVRSLSCNRPEQVWVSDITYIRMGNQWSYLSLITDAYSRKIMGYSLRTDMSVQGCIEALQMALINRSYPNEPLIHHSDRGSQYCSAAYVKLLRESHIGISMTENGDPYENALAERINGIIKGEFNLYNSNTGFELTCQQVKQSITAYNQLRPHGSCDFLTPDQAHCQQSVLKKRWKTYPKKWASKVHELSTNNPETNQQSNDYL